MKLCYKWPLVILALIAVLFSMGAAQTKLVENLLRGSANLSINELESQYGSLELSDEFLVELELAQMERALQEEDSLGVGDSFMEDDEAGIESISVDDIVEFIGYFIRVMRTRTITTPTIETLTGTFDFTIREVNLQQRGNHIELEAITEFAYLTISDSTQTIMSQPIEAKFFPKHNRWKIKHVQGLFEFFYDCIQRVSPQEVIPEKYLRLAGDFREPPLEKPHRRVNNEITH